MAERDPERIGKHPLHLRSMDARFKHIPWTDLVMTLLLYVAVIVYQGYQYGQGDQTQILPCLYAQDHPESYQEDFYVTSFIASPVNERTIFHFLLRYLGYQQPWIMWGWHFIFSLALIFGWLKIASLGLQHPFYRFLAVFLILIPGYHTSFGGNELYYNSFIPSLVAKAFATWSLYMYLKERYTPWSYGLIVATLIQPLVGLQVFLLSSTALLIFQAFQRKMSLVPWKQMGWYMLVAVPWIWILSHYNGAKTNAAGFMDIMEFRLSHHFFPSAFSAVDMALFILMSILAMRFYKQRLKWMMVLIVVGSLVYTLGVEAYRQPWILYTQWCKSTIWLEAFAFLAIAVNLERWLPISSRWSKPVLILPLVFSGMVIGYRWDAMARMELPYMWPWSKNHSSEVDISLQAGTLTPRDAVFIVPVEFTAFRWYAKRSLYVDYKSMLHQEAFLREWYERMQNIYAYSLKEKKAGFDLSAFSSVLLSEPSNISLQYWSRLGVTHIISPNLNLAELEQVGANDQYAIYKLK